MQRHNLGRIEKPNRSRRDRRLLIEDESKEGDFAEKHSEEGDSEDDEMREDGREGTASMPRSVWLAAIRDPRNLTQPHERLQCNTSAETVSHTYFTDLETIEIHP